MASLTGDVADAVTEWYVPIARAVPALILAVVVTFSADHSAPLGLLTFGIFGVVSGAILVASALRATSSGISRGLGLAQGLILVLAGIFSLALPAAGLPFFIFLLTATAAITGFIELYVGLRALRRGLLGARDSIFVGALTALLAIAVLLVPPGFSQSFTGPDSVERQLTASVVVVGLLGAYWAILGVYLVIGGLSLKWAREPAAETATLTSEA